MSAPLPVSTVSLGTSVVPVVVRQCITGTTGMPVRDVIRYLERQCTHLLTSHGAYSRLAVEMQVKVGDLIEGLVRHELAEIAARQIEGATP